VPQHHSACSGKRLPAFRQWCFFGAMELKCSWYWVPVARGQWSVISGQLSAGVGVITNILADLFS
jgi:hypothetical protein